MSATAFLIAIGLVLLRPLIDSMAREKKRVGLLLFGLGGVLIAAGLVWPWLPAPDPGTLRSSVEGVAQDARWWLVLLGAAWAYQVGINALQEVRRNNEMVALRNDVQAIAAVFERAVMPRHLTKRQQAILTNFLRDYGEPMPVVLKVCAGDVEADGFRADIHAVLLKAGWTVLRIDRATDIQEGLGLQINRSHQDQTLANASNRYDFSRRPDDLLRLGFASAGVRIDFAGSGGGPTMVAELIILIGRSRKDTYVFEPPDRF